jgi:hypothetical protein
VLGLHVSATVCDDVCVPDPLKVSFKLASLALLVKVMLPGELPDAAGVNVTVYFAVLPAATVTGKVMPLTAYPEPLQSAEEIVTSALVAERVAFSEAVVPTGTLPKFSVVGDTDSVPEPGGVVTT